MADHFPAVFHGWCSCLWGLNGMLWFFSFFSIDLSARCLCVWTLKTSAFLFSYARNLTRINFFDCKIIDWGDSWFVINVDEYGYYDWTFFFLISNMYFTSNWLATIHMAFGSLGSTFLFPTYLGWSKETLLTGNCVVTYSLITATKC